MRIPPRDYTSQIAQVQERVEQAVKKTSAVRPLQSTDAGHFQPKDAGHPGANVSYSRGTFNVEGTSVWNPTAWPTVTLCFGSCLLSWPSSSKD